MWLVAILWPPVAIMAALVVWATASRLRRLAHAHRSKAVARKRASSVAASARRRVPLQGKAAAEAGKKLAEEAPPRLPGCAHDIALRVLSAAGETAVVSIDSRAPGEALLRRARCCLGESLADLLLPSGEALDLAAPLQAQGLVEGDVLHAQKSAPRRPELSPKARVEIMRYSIDEYASQISHSLDSFSVAVTAAHEPDVIAEANEETVRADFEEDHFMLKVRGRKADYVLRRRAGQKGAVRGEHLPVGFQICPPRCSVTIVPGKKIELTLRPFPDDWLEVGVRVLVQGLKESPELNGLLGTVTGYAEAQGKAVPQRYVVKLDEGNATKKFKRGNLALQEAKPPDAADAAAGAGSRSAICDSKASAHASEKAASEAPQVDPSGGALAWSKARRSAGLEAQRLQLLEELP